MRSFTDLFGPSPFEPLQKHMAKAVQCASQVPIMVDALLASDGPALRDAHART